MKCEQLPVKIVVYLPSERADGTPIFTTIAYDGAFIRWAMGMFGFGGCTLIDAAEGIWINSSGHLVTEKIRQAVFFVKQEGGCRDTSPTRLIRELAEYVLDKYEQEAVSIEINGELLIFSKETP